MKNDIGIVSPQNNIGTAGVGFVVVPQGVDRQEYIDDCYHTNTVTISGGMGYGYFCNVNVDVNTMQLLEFPSNVGRDIRGTAVVWVKDSVHNVPVIVACLRKQEDFYILQENQYLVKRKTQTTSVLLYADGSQAQYEVNIVGDREHPSLMDIKITSENADSVFNLYVDKELNVSSRKKINIVSESELNVNIKEDGDVKTEITYKQGEGFHYKDEFGNEIKCKDGEINIISDKINHNNGNEPMVLGDKLETLLNDILDAIMQLTVVTPVGTSSVPVNTAVFGQIKARVNQIKSSKSNLE